MTREQLKAHILYKLSRHRRWGDTHTELINVRSALPCNWQPKAEEIARELANDDLLTWLKKTGQIHVSLNIHRKKQIMEIIEKYYGKQAW